MKPSLTLLGLLTFMVTAGAQPAPQPGAPVPPAPRSAAAEKAAAEKAAAEKKAKASAKTAPAAKTVADPKAKVKKEEPPAKIEGMEISRGARGFLGLQIVNSTFKLSFYDAKKKPIAPDMANAVLRWNVSYQKQPERAFLTPSGTAMMGEKTVKPPYAFRLSIMLFKDAGGGDAAEAGAENFTVDFAQ
ncbi:MAG: hypothetical protein EXS37_18695 [Opitutus sp.]|nr:hypothetical protein [Opitutus sp.]